MPLTTTLVKSREYEWAIISGIFEIIVAVGSNNKYWCCGNPKCHYALRLSGNLPKVCVKCGNEIDWVGIKTRLIKVCPTCARRGIYGEVYCDMHVPAVKLVDKEVSL